MRVQFPLVRLLLSDAFGSIADIRSCGSTGTGDADASRIESRNRALGDGMAALLMNFLLGAAALYVGIVVLDSVLRWTLYWLGPLLHRDMYGPDGWLIDTASKKGIFDRASWL